MAEQRILSVKESTEIWLSDAERAEAKVTINALTVRAKTILGDEKYVTIDLPDSRHITIVQPHGSMGYEETEVIIDMIAPGSSLSNITDAYLVFLDQVINRPNKWIFVEVTNLNGSKTTIKLDPHNRPGRENYEVGKEELNELLMLLAPDSRR